MHLPARLFAPPSFCSLLDAQQFVMTVGLSLVVSLPSINSEQRFFGHRKGLTLSFSFSFLLLLLISCFSD